MGGQSADDPGSLRNDLPTILDVLAPRGDVVEVGDEGRRGGKRREEAEEAEEASASGCKRRGIHRVYGRMHPRFRFVPMLVRGGVQGSAMSGGPIQDDVHVEGPHVSP